MGRGSLGALMAGLVLLATPVGAAATPADVTATHALARATNTLVRASSPDVARGLAAIRGYTSQTIASCQAVGAGSPQNHDSEQLDHELIGALTVVGYRTAPRPIAVFARAVRRLRWSNPRLTRAVRTFATKLAGLSTLAVPDVCGDIRGWVASGYATLTASTTQFNQSYARVDPGAEETPLIIRLATPYGTPSDIPVLHRVERLEAKLAQAEADAVEDYTRLIVSLDLNQ